MITFKNFPVIFILCTLLVDQTKGQAEGEKAHFQVHNKEQGKLEIHATKKMAKITASADSVQLVLQPGQEKVPEEDVIAHHVKVHAIHGGVLRSLKRDLISGRNKLTHPPKKHQHIIRKKKSKLIGRRKATIGGIKKDSDARDDTFNNVLGGDKSTRMKIKMRKGNVRSKGSNIVGKKNFVKTNNINSKADIKSSKTGGNKKTRITNHKKIKDIAGNKKSSVEKEMRVHGQSGHLHVHTDHNVTALDSQTGKLEVYIKNPEHYEEVPEEHSEMLHIDVYTQEAYKKNQQFYPLKLHILKDTNGLKKSRVELISNNSSENGNKTIDNKNEKNVSNNSDGIKNNVTSNINGTDKHDENKVSLNSNENDTRINNNNNSSIKNDATNSSIGNESSKINIDNIESHVSNNNSNVDNIKNDSNINKRHSKRFTVNRNIARNLKTKGARDGTKLHPCAVPPCSL